MNKFWNNTLENYLFKIAMDDNIDHNQSGNPVQGEEEQKETELRDADREYINQAAGALETSEPVDHMQLIEHINQPFHRMVMLIMSN